MATLYEARIFDPFGSLLTVVVNFVDEGGAGLDYVLNAGQVGALTLTLPPSFDAKLLRLDGRIGVYRSIQGRPPALDGQAMWLIRKVQYTQQATTVTAYHATQLLQRRHVLYAAGSTYASKTATAAGNLLKAVVRENMGTLVNSTRDGVETYADVSAYLAVQADVGDGASIAKAFARRNLLDVVQEIAQASTTAGTYLVAEVVAPTDSTLELRAYATQRGNDHRASSGQPVIFSPERGNMENVILDIDRTNEVTFVTAGGQGEGVNRLIATSTDTSRMGESPFGRIEDFADMANVAESAQLQDDADAALRAGKPSITLTGDLVETGATTRGIHFDYGDQATVEFRGFQYDVRLDVIRVSVQGGSERSQVQFRSVL